MFYIVFFILKNERCERIAQVAHQKWATMRELLRSLNKNEQPWGSRSGRSPKMSELANCLFFWANRSIAHFFEKTRDSLRKPLSEFPALLSYKCIHMENVELYSQVRLRQLNLSVSWRKVVQEIQTFKETFSCPESAQFDF